MAADRIVIMGAGMAGFGASHRLHAAGLRATVYEMESRVGGHTRSFVHEGQWIFDDGPHVSFTRDKRIQDLSMQGRRLVPTFRSLTIEDANIWNYSNCYVTTLEVWDLEVRATGTEQVLSTQLEEPNRVKYQMKREDGNWRVLFRTIQ